MNRIAMILVLCAVCFGCISRPYSSVISASKITRSVDGPFHRRNVSSSKQVQLSIDYDGPRFGFELRGIIVDPSMEAECIKFLWQYLTMSTIFVTDENGVDSRRGIMLVATTQSASVDVSTGKTHYTVENFQVLQAMMVEDGLARVDRSDNGHAFVEKLLQAEEVARKNKAGMWRASASVAHE